MPRYEKYDTDGTLLARRITDDETGDLIEEWPDPIAESSADD